MSTGKNLCIQSSLLSEATITTRRMICDPRSCILPSPGRVWVSTMRSTSPTAHTLVSALKKNSIFMVILTFLLTSFGAAFVLYLTLSQDGKRRMRLTISKDQWQLSSMRYDRYHHDTCHAFHMTAPGTGIVPLVG